MAKGGKVTVDASRLAAKMNLAALVARRTCEAAVKAEVSAIGSDARAAVAVRSGEAREGIQEQSSGTEGQVDATARHSKFIEHGTYKDEAQPFMGPAAERSRVRWPARAGAMLKTALGGIK